MRTRIAIFIAVFQSLLLLAHWFVYSTWVRFWGISDPSEISKLQLTMVILSVSFVAASLLAFRYFNIAVRALYKLSAVCVGAANYFLLAACACWLVYGGARLARTHIEVRQMAAAMFGVAIAASVYGVANAAWTRVARITVMLPNLPEAWRGRTAVLVSDLHLGHVRGHAFAKRIVSRVNRLRPDVVFLPGDLYDGTAADFNRLAEPLAKLSAPLGTFFVTGNHEEFRAPGKYLEAVRRAGVRVLNNEKAMLDGLQVVGVYYRDSIRPERFRAILRDAALEPQRASVLLVHSPHQLPIAEEEGISLQLSGHTHRGQFFPFTWIVSRIFGPYAYGLHRFGKMMVYTTSGAGTWGPPLRVGSNPEIVLIRFE